MQLLPDHINALFPDDLFAALKQIDDGYSPDILSDAERAKYAALSHPERRKEFLCARSLVNELGGYANLEGPLRIQKDKWGKPSALNENRQFNVSISHAGSLIAGVLSLQGEVGVDLEPTSRSVPDRLFNRILHPHEKKTMGREPPLRIWTIKEAFLKLKGCGLRVNMNSVCLKQLDEIRYTAPLFTDRIDKEKKAIICSFQFEQYWMAVAFEQASEHIINDDL